MPPAHTPLSNCIANKVKRLSVRLDGHPSNEIGYRPWYGCGVDRAFGTDDDDEQDFKRQENVGWYRRTTVDGLPNAGIYGPNRGKSTTKTWHAEELLSWAASVNQRPLGLSNMLPSFEKMTEFNFEASSEDDSAFGPRWDYLLGNSIAQVVKALPPGLKNLTLDTCGSVLRKSDHDRLPAHLCSLISLRLQDFEHVRLRMRHICPKILDTTKFVDENPPRLKLLIIRLCLPYFPEASYEMHDGITEFDTQACHSYQGNNQSLPTAMIDAGVQFRQKTEIAENASFISISWIIVDRSLHRRLRTVSGVTGGVW